MGELERLELVVARYAEDLQWLRRVPRRFEVRVYNKGEAVDPMPRRRGLVITPLANQGREEQAYLHHIVEHYDTLADVTVFAQGKPFDHVPDFHKALHRIAFRQETITGFRWFGFIVDQDDAEGSQLFQRWSKNPRAEPLPLRAFWTQLWGQLPPDTVTFYPSAHFAVTAELIRRQPRAFYEKARQISADLPHAGHCFERTWDRVFGVDGIPADLRAAPKPVYLRKIRRLTA